MSLGKYEPNEVGFWWFNAGEIDLSCFEFEVRKISYYSGKEIVVVEFDCSDMPVLSLHGADYLDEYDRKLTLGLAILLGLAS